MTHDTEFISFLISKFGEVVVRRDFYSVYWNFSMDSSQVLVLAEIINKWGYSMIVAIDESKIKITIYNPTGVEE